MKRSWGQELSGTVLNAKLKGKPSEACLGNRTALQNQPRRPREFASSLSLSLSLSVSLSLCSRTQGELVISLSLFALSLFLPLLSLSLSLSRQNLQAWRVCYLSPLHSLHRHTQPKESLMYLYAPLNLQTNLQTSWRIGVQIALVEGITCTIIYYPTQRPSLINKLMKDACCERHFLTIRLILQLGRM